MGYYIGTKTQLEAYNQLVTESENYQGTTTQGANVIEPPDGKTFAVAAHEKYKVEYPMLDTLPSTWNI